MSEPSEVSLLCWDFPDVVQSAYVLRQRGCFDARQSRHRFRARIVGNRRRLSLLPSVRKPGAPPKMATPLQFTGPGLSWRSMKGAAVGSRQGTT